jgi:plasmid stabilization system protein ParE
VNLRVSDRARRRIRAEDKWWRHNRSLAPDLFKQELADACDRILRAPRVRQVYATIEGTSIWRVLMPVTEQHVYFSIDEEADEVVIETVWGARRQRGPKL